MAQIISLIIIGRHLPYGLVVRIRRSHRRGPGSIPGVGKALFFSFFFRFVVFDTLNIFPSHSSSNKMM